MTTQVTEKEDWISRLNKFVNNAEKLGKYPASTAGGLRSVLKIVSEGLTDDEPTDLDYIVEHLDEIFHRQMDRLNLSSASLGVYISRANRIVSDFKKFGTDAKSLHAWKPQLTRRAISKRKTERASGMNDIASHIVPVQHFPMTSPTQNRLGVRTLQWSLRPDLVIQIQLPVDLNKNDVDRLKKLLDLECELTLTTAKQSEEK